MSEEFSIKINEELKYKGKQQIVYIDMSDMTHIYKFEIIITKVYCEFLEI